MRDAAIAEFLMEDASAALDVLAFGLTRYKLAFNDMGCRAHCLALGIGALRALPARRVIGVGEGRDPLLEAARAIGAKSIAAVGVRHRRDLDMGLRQLVDEARGQARLP